MRWALIVAVLQSLGVPLSDAAAEDETQVIEHLLAAVGSSGCTFIRNGKEYPADDAEKHLRMKYRRGKRWAPTAEKFIDRIATKSSFSGKPYYIRCGDMAARPTSEWFREELANHSPGKDRESR